MRLYFFNIAYLQSVCCRLRIFSFLLVYFFFILQTRLKLTCIAVLPNLFTPFTLTPLESKSRTRSVSPVAAALVSSSSSCIIIIIIIISPLKNFALTGKNYCENIHTSHCILILCVAGRRRLRKRVKSAPL